MKPGVLDAIRRDEADFALVHVPVQIRVEARATGELEERQLVSRFLIEPPGRLVAGSAVMGRLQLAVCKVVDRDHLEALAGILVLDEGLAVARYLLTHRERLVLPKMFQPT